jgi:carbonic anhydrase
VREIVEVTAGADLDEVRRLFGEYAAWIGVDLSFQGFARELAELPGEYVAPDGTLLLARVDGGAAGCVAAHRWGPDVCEMKRLFVSDRFRGTGCGTALAQQVVAWARRTQYRRILLDTLPSMEMAHLLYVRLGFREVAPYRFNPVPGAKFMALALE